MQGLRFRLEGLGVFKKSTPRDSRGISGSKGNYGGLHSGSYGEYFEKLLYE